MDAWWLLLVFLRASLLSVSGQTALPLLRQDLLAAGLTTDQRLIEALTIGRLGTGPGGLYIVAIGYFTMGLIGAFVAVIATIVPPLLVVPLAAFLRPRLASARVNGTIRGVALATSGLVVVTSIQLLIAESNGGIPAAWQILVLAAAAALALQGRRHPIWVILAAAILGIVLVGPS
jgi:chromate transporter